MMQWLGFAAAPVAPARGSLDRADLPSLLNADQGAPQLQSTGQTSAAKVRLVSSPVWREPLPVAADELSALLKVDGFNEEMLALRSQWVHTKELRVVGATWNLAGAMEPPPDLNLDEWLALDQMADIYAVGLQEVVPLSAGTMLGAVDTLQASRNWELAILDALNRSAANGASAEPAATAESPAAVRQRTPSEPGSVLPASTPASGAADPGALPHRSMDHGLDPDDLEPVPLTPQTPARDACPSPTAGSSDPRAAPGSAQEADGEGGSKAADRGTSTQNGAGAGALEGAPEAASEADANGQRGKLEPGLRAVKPRTQGYYALVASRQMLGIHLCVWVRSSLRPHVHSLQACSVATGLMGFLGNKGAVAISLCVHETSFCFVSAHLTAGEDKAAAEQRNLDFTEILRRTSFPRPPDAQRPPDQQQQQQQQQPSAARPIGGGARLPEKIKDHDRVMLLGDLNYRLDMPDSEARLLLSQQDWDQLARSDQLHKQLGGSSVFAGWLEGPLYFAPTYKYMVGSSNYVGDYFVEGEKRRTPAWTDRVLWFINPASEGDCMKLLSYGRTELQMSDHRPVSVVFLVAVDAVKLSALRDMAPIARSRLDARQRMCIPQCTLSTHSVDFGQVEYAKLVRRTVDLCNSGQVAAQFEVKVMAGGSAGEGGGTGDQGGPAFPEGTFAAGSLDADAHPETPWLAVEPAKGIVPPGHTITLSLHAWVVAGQTRIDRLVMQGGALGLIGIVAVEGGGGMFLECAGTYVPSSWGLRLDWLSALGDKPVRDFRCTDILSRAQELAPTRQQSRHSELSGQQGNGDALAGAIPVSVRAMSQVGSWAEGKEESKAVEVPKEIERMLAHLQGTRQDIAVLFDLKTLAFDISWLDDDMIPGISQRPFLRSPALAPPARVSAGIFPDLSALAPYSSPARQCIPGATSLHRAGSNPESIFGQWEAEVGPIREALDHGEPLPQCISLSCPGLAARSSSASGVPPIPPPERSTPRSASGAYSSVAWEADPRGTALGTPTQSVSPQTMAKALISFLMALPEPIIAPGAALAEIDSREAAWQRGEAAALACSSLDTLPLAVLHGILNLIQDLLRHRVANRLAVQELAVVLVLALAPRMLPRSRDPLRPWNDEQKQTLKRRLWFMQALIEDARARAK